MAPILTAEEVKPENVSALADMLWKLYRADAISKYTWTRAQKELSAWAS